MSQEAHWDAVYNARSDRDLSWFEARPDLTLEVIAAYCTPGQPVIDIGGGASRLVDHLLLDGFRDVSVLDLSGAALDVGRQRLGADAAKVDWIAADVTKWRATRGYGLWQDRAVFHFLTEDRDRAGYVAAMGAALTVGAHAIISSFAEDGPEKCSGLPVVRYSPDSLADEVQRHAPGVFARVEARHFEHVTPAGTRQKFQMSVFVREV